jgi:hypothetical protein
MQKRPPSTTGAPSAIAQEVFQLYIANLEIFDRVGGGDRSPLASSMDFFRQRRNGPWNVVARMALWP